MESAAASASYKDLIAQRDALDVQIKQAREQELSEVKTKIKELVEAYGLKAGDIFPPKRVNAGKGRSVAPKYRDPNSGATWSGRGKPPAWIADRPREAFLINAEG
ncbi:H-NS histone family protein [Paracidovorax wautersii]|uniref:H-NS family DNA-binding protein n=1 Tax=Paracidovorax wautersii TaxID=1177982 RepID=A0A1I2HWA8_9BURK|nr:H-NS histone family protein [Paracidovorax wautersii]SFF33670.1 H-NS family DNA-binding protein [Paracidovorax wautersii]